MKSFQFFILFLCLLSSSLFAERCHPNDKKALLKIKNDFNNHPVLNTWVSNTDCCEWTNVICDSNTSRIVELFIYDADIKGTIPASIVGLPYLQRIALYGCNLTGQIIQPITKLSNLHSIDFRNNHLTGTIPSFLSQLRNLGTILLSSNNLTGSIPASLFTLSRLHSLSLDRNKLTGSIPETSVIFKESFYLELSHNQLSGQFPKLLGKSNFNHIDASRNKLEGDISFLFANENLTYIDFSRNRLQFDFSKVPEFSTRLSELYLNHNRIYGNIPQGLTRSTYVSLNVSYNRLCGKIPTGGRFQEMLPTSFIHNKCLCGAPLPECK